MKSSIHKRGQAKILRALKAVLIASILVLCYFEISPKYLIIHWEPITNDISCHYSFLNNSLPLFENNPEIRSIFFHETSCRGGLDSRQACAVESAAVAHPDRQINVLFTSPVSPQVLQYSNLGILLKYPNIFLWRIDMETYTTKTYPGYVVELLKKSNNAVKETADLLKLVTLMKSGGVTLDFDVIVTKSLNNLSQNFIAKRNGNNIAYSVIGLENSGFGRSLSRHLTREIGDHYEPNLNTASAIGITTRALKELCPAAILPAGKHCYGFYVYGPELFYPVYNGWIHKYFSPGNMSDIDNGLAYMHYMWNSITWNMTVHTDSPYAKLAKRFCPQVYKMYGDDFGI